MVYSLIRNKLKIFLLLSTITCIPVCASLKTNLIVQLLSNEKLKSILPHTIKHALIENTQHCSPEELMELLKRLSYQEYKELFSHAQELKKRIVTLPVEQALTLNKWKIKLLIDVCPEYTDILVKHLLKSINNNNALIFAQLPNHVCKKIFVRNPEYYQTIIEALTQTDAHKFLVSLLEDHTDTKYDKHALLMHLIQYDLEHQNILLPKIFSIFDTKNNLILKFFNLMRNNKNGLQTLRIILSPKNPFVDAWHTVVTSIIIDGNYSCDKEMLNILSLYQPRDTRAITEIILGQQITAGSIVPAQLKQLLEKADQKIVNSCLQNIIYKSILQNFPVCINESSLKTYLKKDIPFCITLCKQLLHDYKETHYDKLNTFHIENFKTVLFSLLSIVSSHAPHDFIETIEIITTNRFFTSLLIHYESFNEIIKKIETIINKNSLSAELVKKLVHSVISSPEIFPDVIENLDNITVISWLATIPSIIKTELPYVIQHAHDHGMYSMFIDRYIWALDNMPSLFFDDFHVHVPGIIETFTLSNHSLKTLLNNFPRETVAACIKKLDSLSPLETLRIIYIITPYVTKEEKKILDNIVRTLNTKEAIQHNPIAQALIQKQLNSLNKTPYSTCTQSTNHIKKHLATIANQFGFDLEESNALLTIVERIQEKELEEQLKGNYTFIHAQRWHWHLLADLFKQLWEIAYEETISDYQFLRFEKKPTWLKKVQESFVRKEIMKTGRTDNNRPLLLFMNHALFGNSNNFGSCSFSYFVQCHDLSKITITIKDLFEIFGLTTVYKKYQQQFEELAKIHSQASEHGNMLLISCTPEQVKKSIYVARPGGYKSSAKIFGEYTTNVTAIIDALRADKNALKESDKIEYCMALTHDLALDPHNGPRIYSFNTADQTILKQYEALRDELFKAIKNECKELLQ